jgi:hypothetical protein
MDITRAVPASAFPEVAPAQYSAPTMIRTKHTNVMATLTKVRRPNLSADSDHMSTESRLQQLNHISMTCLALVRKAHLKITVPRNGSWSPASAKKSAIVSESEVV